MQTQESTRDSTKPAQFVPPHGRGKLNRGGTPGNKGSNGRPPDAFKALCREIGYGGLERVAGIISGSNDALAIAAWRAVCEQGFDKVTTELRVNVETRDLMRAIPQVLQANGLEPSLILTILQQLGDLVKQQVGQDTSPV